MTPMVQGRPTSPSIHVKCPCGRELRARQEQAGSQITCWDCHASVPVPVPVAPGGWVARLLKMGAKQVLEARTITLMAIGAALVTAALSLRALAGQRLVPEAYAALAPGVWASGVALGLVMIGYGELLRRGSQGDWTRGSHVGVLARLWRALLCLGTGIALVLPLILASARHTLPRPTLAGLAIATPIVLVLPLVMLATYLPGGSIRERVRTVVATIRRHPMAVLASLLLLPASLPLIEGVVFVAARATSTFTFLLLDLYPERAPIRIAHTVPFYAFAEGRKSWVDFRDLDDATILGMYFDSVRQGDTLIGVIPASLTMDTSNKYNLITISLSERGYLAYRMVFTGLIVTCLLAVLAVQARWLGLLSTMDSRRTAASLPPASGGPMALPNLAAENS